MNNLHVILDIDQTMIDSMPFHSYLKNAGNMPKPDFIENDHAIWMRPGLPEFLKYLDKNVKYISIWTNGSDGWLNHVLNNIITIEKQREVIRKGEKSGFAGTTEE